MDIIMIYTIREIDMKTGAEQTRHFTGTLSQTMREAMRGQLRQDTKIVICRYNDDPIAERLHGTWRKCE